MFLINMDFPLSRTFHVVVAIPPSDLFSFFISFTQFVNVPLEALRPIRLDSGDATFYRFSR